MEDLAKKKKKLDEAAWEKLYKEKSTYTRVPRSLLSHAESSAGYAPRTLSRKLDGHGKDVVDKWNTFVAANFKGYKSSAESTYDQFVKQYEESISSSSAGFKVSPMRTCTVPLKSILRELDQVDDNDFMRRLNDSAVIATDYTSLLSTYTRAVMFGIAERGFDVVISIDTSVSVKLRSKSQAPKIEEFLPPQAQRHLNFLTKDNTIPVAPLPYTNLNKLESHQVTNMFKLSHIQYLHTKYLSSAEAKSNETFNTFAIPLEKSDKLPAGRNYIYKESLSTFVTNLCNIWKTGIFGRCLDRLLLIYLRVNLAPLREAKHRKKAEEFVELKKKEKVMPKKTRSSTRQLLRRETKHYNKCTSNAQDSKLCDDRKSEWLRRAELSSNRRTKMYDEHAKSRPTTKFKDTKSFKNKVQPGQSKVDDDNEASADSVDFESALLAGNLVSDTGDSTDAVATLAEIQEDEAVDTEKSKETSGGRIKELKTLTKKLLLAYVDIGHGLSEAIISAWKGSNPPTDEEMKVLMRCIKSIKPYIPPPDAPNCTMMHLPLVLLSNTVQRVAGYGVFTREICPHTSPATIQAFPIDARTLYETATAPHEAKPFCLLDRHYNPISSALWSTALKLDTLGSFFSLGKVQEICDTYGLSFDNRIIYVPNGNVRIQDLLKSPKNAAISYYDERRKTSRGKKEGSASTSRGKGAANQQVSQADDDLVKGKDDEMKSITTIIKQLTKSVSQAVKAVATTRIALRGLSKASNERQVRYQELVTLKRTRDDALVAMLKAKQKLQMLKHSKWLLIYQKQGSKTSSSGSRDKKNPTLQCPPPTLIRPGCCEDAKYCDVGTIVQQSQERGQDIIFGGTDPGVVTMSTTTKITFDQVHDKIRAFNRYSLLANMDDDDAYTETAAPIPSKIEPIPTFCITAHEVNQRTLNRQHEKKRNRRKKRNPDVVSAEKQLSKSSMDAALSPEDILDRHATHVKQRNILRSFYYSNHACKESRTNEIMNRTVLDTLASSERRFLSQRLSSESPPNTVILCIGTAGTGVGSRIKGHAKRGGSKISSRHQRYVPVAMTNEFRTSQTCSSCFNPIVHPMKPKLVKDTWKKVSSKGTSVCINPQMSKISSWDELAKPRFASSRVYRSIGFLAGPNGKTSRLL